MPRKTRNGLIALCCGLLIGSVPMGCGLLGGGSKPRAKGPLLASRYQELPAREVPEFLKGSLLELCELHNAQPYPVSSFGLVTNLRNTGDTTAGSAVYEYIRKIAVTRGFGSRNSGAENMPAEQILHDNRFAIVRVDGLIPPGARKHQKFDLLVSAMQGNNTSSLAHGDLYRVELKVNGANNQAPGYAVDIWGTGEGPLFVNPAYSIVNNPSAPEARASLRKAHVLNGGTVLRDRPLVLRVRKPQLSVARGVENRIDQAFQDLTVAAAQDEALVQINVPYSFNGDWEHFAQVVMHLFVNSSPEFATIKAQQLVEEAVKPDAPLLDISYCWEAMGPTIVPIIRPLITHSSPQVAFAAARAAAIKGDSSAQMVLMNMAKTPQHEFQISAVKTLAMLPPSLAINQMLRSLLDAETTMVRLEAYRALAANEDAHIVSRPVQEKKFRLDLVPSKGPPLIYATRTGMPRIAVIGDRPQISRTGIFSAMDRRLTISPANTGDLVSVYYRGPELPEPVKFVCPPDIALIIARLGGESAPGDKPLDFDYAAIIALLQQMTDQKRLTSAGGGTMPVAFVLQESPSIEQQAREAPVIPDEPVPAVPEQLGSAADSGMNPGGPR